MDQSDQYHRSLSQPRRIFLLIPMWGMQGAAIASTIGYFCLSAAGWILLVKNYPIHLLDFLTSDWMIGSGCFLI